MTTIIKSTPKHLTNARIAHHVATRIAQPFGMEWKRVTVYVRRMANAVVITTTQTEDLPQFVPVVHNYDPLRSTVLPIVRV